MDITEFHAIASDLLDAVRPRTDERNWRSAQSLLNHGEEEEAVDLLLAMLVVNAISVTRGESDTMKRLIDFFPLASYEQGLYAYLTDPNILGKLTVVDVGGSTS